MFRKIWIASMSDLDRLFQSYYVNTSNNIMCTRKQKYFEQVLENKKSGSEMRLGECWPLHSYRLAAFHISCAFRRRIVVIRRRF